jgi:hypothetical protein
MSSLDESSERLDLHQAEIRSKLAVDAGGGLATATTRGRVELGRSDDRSGSGSRPYTVRLLELAVVRLVRRAEAARPARFEAALGRLHLDSPSPACSTARAIALGRGFSAGLHGGLLPPSRHRPQRLGGHAPRVWVTAVEWQARLADDATCSGGRPNRLDLGASGSLAGPRLRLTRRPWRLWWRGPARRSARAHPQPRLVGTRVRPLDWLTSMPTTRTTIVADRERSPCSASIGHRPA